MALLVSLFTIKIPHDDAKKGRPKCGQGNLPDGWQHKRYGMSWNPEPKNREHGALYPFPVSDLFEEIVHESVK